MHKSFPIKSTLLLPLSLLISCSQLKPVQTRTTPPPSVEEKTAEPAVEYFVGNYELFWENAKNQNKPVLIEFWASWCGPCIRMDRETYSNKELGDFINTNFVSYKLDADSFDGLEAAGKYGVDSYPALLILTPDGQLLQYVKGFYLPQGLKDILKSHI